MVLEAGEIVYAADVTALVGAWASAAPTWTASAGTPAIGNGSLVGRHRTISKTKEFDIVLTVSTTTTFGTAGAYWEFTLPGGGTSAQRFTGTGYFFDSSLAQFYMLIWKIDAAATKIRIYRLDATPSAEFLNNAPVTPADGDVLVLNGTVEIT